MKTFKDLKFVRHKGILKAEIFFSNNYVIECSCLDTHINDKSGFIVIAYSFDGNEYNLLKNQTFGLLYKDYVEYIMKELQELPSYKGEEK